MSYKSHFQNPISRTHILYDHSLCGSGKSHFQKIQISNGGRFIVACPLTRQLDQYEKDLKALNPHLKIFNIHSKNTKKNIISTLNDLSREVHPDDNNIVFLLTHSTLLKLDTFYFRNFKELLSYDLIIDELPAFTEVFSLRLLDNIDMFNDLFCLVDTDKPGVKEILVKPLKNKIIREKIDHAHNNRDDFLNVENYLKLLKTSQNHYSSLFCSSSDALILERLKNQLLSSSQAKKNGYGKLRLFLVVKESFFDQFKSVLILSEDFEESLFFKIYSKNKKIKFSKVQRPHESFLDLIHISRKHRTKRPTEIRYLINSVDCTFTNFHSDILLEKEQKVINPFSIYKSLVGDFFGEEKFLYCKNKSVAEGFENGVEISSHSIGVNEYIDHQNICWSSCLYLKSDLYHILETFGFSSKEIKEYYFDSKMKQMIFRSNIRDESSEKPLKIALQTKHQAEIIRSLFVEDDHHLINIAQFDLNEIDQKAIDRIADDFDLTEYEKAEKAIEGLHKKCLEKLPEKKNLYTTNIFVDHFSNLENETKCCLFWDDLVDEIRNISKQKFKNKTEVPKMVFASFKNQNGPRKKENFLNTQFLIFDFDGGIPEYIVKNIFKSYNYILHFTWSNTSVPFTESKKMQYGKKKFRLIIPTDRPMVKEVHNLVWEHFNQILKNYIDNFRLKLDDKEDKEKVHGVGLDLNSKNIVQMFDLPSKIGKSGRSTHQNIESVTDKQMVDVANILQNNFAFNELVREKYERTISEKNKVSYEFSSEEVERRVAEVNKGFSTTISKNSEVSRYFYTLKDTGIDKNDIAHACFTKVEGRDAYNQVKRLVLRL